MNKVFTAKTHNELVKIQLESERFGRGSQAALADHLGLKASFVSSVLAGRQSFSLEHGIPIAQFLGLKEIERDFLLLLIQRDRAGTKDLKSHFDTRIEKYLNRALRTPSRVKRGKGNLSPEEVRTYYESWIYPAVHMAILNPKVRDPAALTQAFGLDPKQIRKALSVLEDLGFIQKKSDGWVSLQKSIHIGQDSFPLINHHRNYRLEAMRSMEKEDPTDLHYTAVMSLDKNAAAQIRELLLQAIEKADPVIQAANDTQVEILNIDLFKLGKAVE